MSYTCAATKLQSTIVTELYINLLTWPFLKLKLPKEHGPFYSSVTIVLWSFVAAQV